MCSSVGVLNQWLCIHDGPVERNGLLQLPMVLLYLLPVLLCLPLELLLLHVFIMDAIIWYPLSPRDCLWPVSTYAFIIPPSFSYVLCHSPWFPNAVSISYIPSCIAVTTVHFAGSLLFTCSSCTWNDTQRHFFLPTPLLYLKPSLGYSSTISSSALGMSSTQDKTETPQ